MILRKIVAGPFPEFKPLLRGWVRATMRYGRVWEWSDMPWRYNERASLSILAGAAWLEGGIALEEYSAEKTGAMTGAKSNTRRWGRSDLYVSTGQRDYILEAKSCWVGVGSRDPGARVRERLAAAVADVRCVPREPYLGRAAAVFVGVYAPAHHRNQPGVLQDRLRKFFSDDLKEFARAWIVATDCFSVKEHDGRVYPGAALVLTKVKGR